MSDAEAHGRMGSVIAFLALSGLASHGLGDWRRGLSAVERAMALAEPEGYARVFADEGAPMAVLLRRARISGIAPEYAGRLLSILGRGLAHASAPANGELSGAAAALGAQRAAHPFIEPLTEREHEVLRLIVAGASNQEIARRLTVSVGTVKSHVYHIFGKLGVKSRTQAVFRASTLPVG